MKRALISVSDKNGIIELARELENLGFELISTGGTYQTLQKAGVKVKAVSDVTLFPEILDGRVKTLHPAIHGGLLAIRDNEEHLRQLRENKITPIDLVVVNLYPFQQTISKEDVTIAEAIENIDIGGPSMLRSAAKNHQFVTVLVDPEDYQGVIRELKEKGDVDLNTRRRLAAKVFRHTASYDAIIADYMSNLVGELFPEKLTKTYEKIADLRYGENPHQQAAFYRAPFHGSTTIANAEQLHGKELSYNNINDANAAIQIVKEFKEPVVVAVKHMNPCGVGVGSDLYTAWEKAYSADPVSIFGGIIATNQVVDRKTAEKLKEIFLEIIIAPDFTEEGLTILQQKKNLRLLKLANLAKREKGLQLTSVEGGLLVQELDSYNLQEDELKVVTERKPTTEEIKQLLFAWKIVKHVKSNAILLAKDYQTIGVGAGQMNRVGAAKIAIEQAGSKAKGAVLASDAFFPMPDTVEEAAKAGITAIIQPGGSIRDEDSIKEANKHGIAMVFTNIRHFKH